MQNDLSPNSRLALTIPYYDSSDDDDFEFSTTTPTPTASTPTEDQKETDDTQEISSAWTVCVTADQFKRFFEILKLPAHVNVTKSREALRKLYGQNDINYYHFQHLYFLEALEYLQSKNPELIAAEKAVYDQILKRTKTTNKMVEAAAQVITTKILFPPPKFSGTNDIFSHYVTEYDMHANMNGWGNAEKMKFLPFYLTGLAKQTYVRTIRKYNGIAGQIDTWDKLIDKLKIAFNQDASIAALESVLHKRVQKDDESPMEYLSNIVELCYKVKPNMDESDICKYIMNGFNSKIIASIGAFSNNTIEKIQANIHAYEKQQILLNGKEDRDKLNDLTKKYEQLMLKINSGELGKEQAKTETVNRIADAPNQHIPNPPNSIQAPPPVWPYQTPVPGQAPVQTPYVTPAQFPPYLPVAQPGRMPLYCTNCHKTGHTVDRCYLIYGRPQRNSNNNNNRRNNNNNRNKKCYNCNRFGHISAECRSNRNNQNQGQRRNNKYCTNCRKTNHDTDKCRYLQNNNQQTNTDAQQPKN